RKHARQWRCPRLTLAQHIQDALLVVDLLFALALAFLCFEGKPSPCRRCTRASTVPRSNSLRRSFVQILLEKAQQLQLNNLWSPSRPILGVSPFNIWDGLLARFGQTWRVALGGASAWPHKLELFCKLSGSWPRHILFRIDGDI
ncbi:unnamed protein product, partial [Effrenium voratum]